MSETRNWIIIAAITACLYTLLLGFALTATEVNRVSAVVTVFSSLGIVASMMFTAYQLSQARKASIVENYGKLLGLQFELRKLRVDDPKLAAVYEIDNVGTEDEIKFHFFNLMQLSLFELAWCSYREGQLSGEHFEWWKERIQNLAASEATFAKLLAKIETRPAIMHPEFLALVKKFHRKP